MKLPIKALKRAGAAVALASVVAVGGGLVAAAPASAAAGVLQICSKGTYSTDVEFPERGGARSVIVPSGRCINLPLGTSTRVEKIHVFGHVYPAVFLVTAASVRPSRGGSVITFGTPQNCWAATPAL
ncbi:hypothetical protein [Lentzea sp. CA-135723]|uniref:hypothetical protein n=1 Tax=Lentzea sp. CA-135723 TaxID=3239950 RepID=UPI003D932B14